MTEHNIRDIAWQMEEHLETPVSQQLVELMPLEDRIRFIKQNYLWSISKISREGIRKICKDYLDKAKQKVFKKYEPKNEIDKLFLSQKLK